MKKTKSCIGSHSLRRSCGCGFWGYMLAARDNGVFALEDIEGDRTALNAFAFEGLARG